MTQQELTPDEVRAVEEFRENKKAREARETALNQIECDLRAGKVLAPEQTALLSEVAKEAGIR